MNECRGGVEKLRKPGELSLNLNAKDVQCTGGFGVPRRIAFPPSFFVVLAKVEAAEWRRDGGMGGGGGARARVPARRV